MKTVDVARTYIGVTEATGKNDGEPDRLFNRSAGDGAAWCMSFVMRCNEESTDPRIARTNGEWWAYRSVQAAEDALILRGWWQARDSHDPAPNDLVFYGDRGASDAAPKGRHVGIVADVLRDTEGAVVVLMTIEGNQGNAVRAVTHDLRKDEVRRRITGYARFPGAADPS